MKKNGVKERLKRVRAFSLLELLITLTIMGALMVLSVNGYRYFFQKTEAKTEMMHLYRTISFAKNEAIHKNTMITVCPYKNSADCGDDFSKGFIVFIDHAKDGELHSPKDILLEEKLTSKHGYIIWNNFKKKSFLQITSLGFTNQQNGSFVYYPDELKLSISRSGRLRFDKS